MYACYVRTRVMIRASARGARSVSYAGGERNSPQGGRRRKRWAYVREGLLANTCA